MSSCAGADEEAMFFVRRRCALRIVEKLQVESVAIRDCLVDLLLTASQKGKSAQLIESKFGKVQAVLFSACIIEGNYSAVQRLAEEGRISLFSAESMLRQLRYCSEELAQESGYSDLLALMKIHSEMKQKDREGGV